MTSVVVRISLNFNEKDDFCISYVLFLIPQDEFLFIYLPDRS
jgi:hypothetical protein